MPGWRLHVELDEPDAVMAVVISADEKLNDTAGFASAGPVRDAASPAPWELYAIGVEASLRGSGAADALLTAVTGERPTVVWVIEDNARALSFYVRHGFVADGASRLHESLGVPEIRLVSPGRHTPERRSSLGR